MDTINKNHENSDCKHSSINSSQGETEQYGLYYTTADALIISTHLFYQCEPKSYTNIQIEVLT